VKARAEKEIKIKNKMNKLKRKGTASKQTGKYQEKYFSLKLGNYLTPMTEQRNKSTLTESLNDTKHRDGKMRYQNSVSKVGKGAVGSAFKIKCRTV